MYRSCRGALCTQQDASCLLTQSFPLPVQVKGSDLRVVPFKVREVEEVHVRLGISGLSAVKNRLEREQAVLTCSEKMIQAATVAVSITELDRKKQQESYFMGFSRACP